MTLVSLTNTSLLFTYFFLFFYFWEVTPVQPPGSAWDYMGSLFSTKHKAKKNEAINELVGKLS